MKNTFQSSRYFMFNDAKNTSLQPRILLFIPCSKKKKNRLKYRKLGLILILIRYLFLILKNMGVDIDRLLLEGKLLVPGSFFVMCSCNLQL